MEVLSKVKVVDGGSRETGQGIHVSYFTATLMVAGTSSATLPVALFVIVNSSWIAQKKSAERLGAITASGSRCQSVVPPSGTTRPSEKTAEKRHAIAGECIPKMPLGLLISNGAENGFF